ncbi:DUF3500 domain-containing protein [Rubritalea spongiae]|uniref:DUF3500 domain-containing protein n=1 Tax=Rubritalea spongiae TaxID=430797 RepID=A0ABW5DYK4_9BACT
MKKIFTFLLLSVLPLSAHEHHDLEKVSAEMAKAANSLLKSLDEETAKRAQFPFKADERQNWNYVPTSRKGVSLENLSGQQIELVRQLLQSALSDPGLKKVDTIIALEAFLGETENRPDFRNSKAYFTTIFGDPSATGTWGWRFEGHHLSLNYTIIDGKPSSLTPSFFAANPAEVRADHKMKGTRALAAEEDLARALASNIAKTNQAIIFSKKPPREILTRSTRQFDQLAPVGVATKAMNAEQQQALLTLIEEFSKRHRKELNEATMKQIKAEFTMLHFGWAGSLEPEQPFYYRIQSTSFLIEVANVQNKGNHIHAVWRDSANDFAIDILADHIHSDH